MWHICSHNTHINIYKTRSNSNISKLLTKAACYRNTEIVLHLTALSYIKCVVLPILIIMYTYIYKQ